jgi:hypothetical protein
MTDQPEYANGLRALATFPVWWGLPEGRGTSEERIQWVTRNIATDQALTRRGLNAAEVRSGKRPRTMSGPEALAKLAALT